MRLDDHYKLSMAIFSYDALGMPRIDHTECDSMIIMNSVWLDLLMTHSVCLKLITLSSS